VLLLLLLLLLLFIIIIMITSIIKIMNNFFLGLFAVQFGQNLEQKSNNPKSNLEEKNSDNSQNWTKPHNV